MIIPPWNDLEFAAALRPAFEGMPIPSLFIPGFIAPALARKLRAQVRGKLRPFAFPTRGQYRHASSPRNPELEWTLHAFAQAVTGLALARGTARWLLLGRGDHSLRLDDALLRCKAERFLEVTLDFSARTVADARVVYTVGTQTLILPHAPGIISLVERTPEVSRYDARLTHKTGRAEVFRLRLQLPFR